MALVQTTASAAIGVNDLSMTVTSATGFAAGYVVRVDNEFMVVGPSYTSGTTIPLYRRGDQGSQQVAHNILAEVVCGIASDWPAQPVAQYSQVQPNLNDFVTLGANVSLTYPNKNTVYLITKATACAITLAAPATKGTDGVWVTFLSATAAAHTVTYTPGCYGDTTSSDVATFAAKAGASMTAISYQGALGVQSLANVTLA